MEQTPTAQLATEYLRLGGGRLGPIDDNQLSTRRWEHESRAAEAFWNAHIARLDKATRDEVISYLPTINQV